MLGGRQIFGLAIFVFVVVSWVAWYDWSKFYSSACEEWGSSAIDCNSESYRPADKVKHLHEYVRNPGNAKSFQQYQQLDTNRVKYSAAVLKTDNGVYYLNAFPDSLQVLFVKNGMQDPEFGWQDFDADGTIDFATRRLVDKSPPVVYDSEMGLNRDLRPIFQAAYSMHVETITTRLGL